MMSAATLLAHALPLACSGHLLIDLPVFMGPVFVLVGWLLVMTRRARKQEARSL
jgi:Mn2+/Fe2+ NRAMP family transporter